MVTTPSNPKPGRRGVRVRRRTAAAGLVLVAAAALTLLISPALMSGRAGRQWLLGRANRAVAPATIGFTSMTFSWFGPTRLSGFEIRDAEGRRVVVAPRATWDRTFRQVLMERPVLGTLRLDRPAIEVVRGADGAINLYDALRPVLGLDRRTQARVVVADGRLTVRGRGLAEPVAAGHADVTIDVTPGPGPVTWTARLANGDRGGPAEALAVDGRLEAAGGGLALKVVGTRWPVALGDGRLTVSGRLDGAITAARAGGRWDLGGDATLSRARAAGTRLAGDTLDAGRVAAAWRVELGAEAWAVRRLAVSSPLGSVRAEGPRGGKDNERVVDLNGTLDLAAVAGQIPHALKLRDGVVLEQGTATVSLKVNDTQGTPSAELSAKVSDLTARDGARSFVLRDPATLTAVFRRSASSGGLEVGTVSVATPYLKAEAKGDPADGLNASGTIDLAGLHKQFGELVDLSRVALAGRGEWTGHYQAGSGQYRGRLDARVTGLKVSGVGPGSVDRDEVALGVELAGPSAGSGLPDGWGDVRARVTAGEVVAEWTGSGAGGRGTAVVSGPVDLAGRKAKAEGNAKARWDETGVTIDSLVATLSPTGGDGAPTPLRLEARGRYDRAAGDLTLSAAGRPGAVGLGESGMKVTGLGGEGGGWKADAQLVGDLTALPAWVAPQLEKVRGRWTALAAARSGGDGTDFGVRVGVEGLGFRGDAAGSAGESVRGDVRGRVEAGGTSVGLTELALRSRFGTLEGSGTIDDPAGTRVADLSGRLSPDWNELGRWLAANVEPGARVAGRPRAWKLRGELRGGGAATLEGEAGVAIDGADVYGLALGKTDLVARSRGGTLVFDAIDATLNEGRVRLVPSYRGAGADGPAALVLGEGSGLTDVRVNDEVSRRVLSYVAPVLDNATRVRGSVSAAIEHAVFPLGGSKAGPTVEGEVVFHDLTFLPGPLAGELFALVNRQDQPLLRLDEPVSLTIADRRVYQKGLVVPVGKLSKVEIEGSVGFDRDLDVVASIPILPTMLADRPVLGAIAADAKVRVPIRGTLQNPEIDREAFRAGMNALGRDLLGKSLVGGAAGLLDRLTRPPDPNAPPPPTLEERRALRQERLRQRRARRGRGEP